MWRSIVTIRGLMQCMCWPFDIRKRRDTDVDEAKALEERCKKRQARAVVTEVALYQRLAGCESG